AEDLARDAFLHGAVFLVNRRNARTAGDLAEIAVLLAAHIVVVYRQAQYPLGLIGKDGDAFRLHESLDRLAGDIGDVVARDGKSMAGGQRHQPGQKQFLHGPPEIVVAKWPQAASVAAHPTIARTCMTVNPRRE